MRYWNAAMVLLCTMALGMAGCWGGHDTSDRNKEVSFQELLQHHGTTSETRTSAQAVEANAVGVWEFPAFDAYLVIAEDGLTQVHRLSTGELIFKLVLRGNQLFFASANGQATDLTVSASGNTLMLQTSEGRELPFTRTRLQDIAGTRNLSTNSPVGVWSFPLFDAYFVIMEDGNAPLYRSSTGDLLLELYLQDNRLLFSSANGPDTAITVTTTDNAVLLTTRNGEELSFTRTSLEEIVSNRGLVAATSTTTTTSPTTTIPEEPNRYGLFSVPNDDRSLQFLNDLGVGWVRLQHRMGEVADDPRLSLMLENGYGLWVTVYYRESTNLSPENQEKLADSRGGFPPLEEAPYREAFQQLLQPLITELERQNKDPGKWLVVQLANEVIPSDVLADQPDPFWNGTAQEYLDVLSLTYDTVKSIHSSIPVAVGGISSSMLEVAINPDLAAQLPTVPTWNNRLLQSSENRFDWVDIHLFHSIDDIPAKVAVVKERWTGPLACTECGGPDERSGVTYSDELHAENLPLRFQAAFDAGVDRVFWPGLLDFGDIVEPEISQVGLLKEDFTPKPGFAVYQQLIQDNP